MSTITKNAIMRAKIEGVLTDLMVKTNIENVIYDDNTTLAAKLTEIVASIAAKANATHSHEQSEVTGLVDTLATLATTEAMNAAVTALKQEMLGDTPVEAYNTFTELAQYIAEHKEAADALTAAIGQKADKATTLSGYGITDAYTMEQVDAKIQEVTGGESAAEVKQALDAYKTSNDGRVTELENKAHEHDNKAVLDAITQGDVDAWDGKSNIYYSATEPQNLTDGDLWVQIVE